MSDVNLYLLNRDCPGSWDTYSAMLVAAENEDEAFKISCDCVPICNVWKYEEGHPVGEEIEDVAWPRREFIKIAVIGKADPGIKKGVILQDYLQD